MELLFQSLFYALINISSQVSIYILLSLHSMYITVFMSALLIMPISFDCDSGSIDLWTQLLTRLKQKLQRRKQKRKKTNTFSGMKSSRLKDKDRDENEEEEEDEDEVEEKKVDDTEEERLLVDHESSNVSILC